MLNVYARLVPAPEKSRTKLAQKQHCPQRQLSALRAGLCVWYYPTILSCARKAPGQNCRRCPTPLRSAQRTAEIWADHPVDRLSGRRNHTAHPCPYLYAVFRRHLFGHRNICIFVARALLLQHHRVRPRTCFRPLMRREPRTRELSVLGPPGAFLLRRNEKARLTSGRRLYQTQRFRARQKKSMPKSTLRPGMITPGTSSYCVSVIFDSSICAAK